MSGLRSGDLARSVRDIRIIFFSLGLGAFAIGTAEFAAMSLVPMIAHTFGVSDPEAGHAIVLYAAGVCIGAPTIALFSAGISRRTMLISMMLFYMLGNGLSAIAPNYLVFLACRFISGLPHGAYFGIASILASSLVPPNKRSQAVGRVILGLTIATIGGVPLANGIGQLIGWRWAFALIAFLALCTSLLIVLFAPKDAPKKDASILNEFTALKIKQVWLTLAIGAVASAASSVFTRTSPRS
ncbi:MFS transporter [Asaia platycodi]|uniref:MFS transporter n=1 Tax=Asaia platycodi TaxID=610243 RepID=UPI000AE4B208|nr:MFS transporter [Asaia platycodi]